jgi:DNA-binding winged helix-turn-helix (wHTH) protein/tetratricopeptide (TPR) repeat protein
MGKHYEFGDFSLDAGTRELARGDERQTLAPKLFDCLVWLIEHRDRAVGRDELIAAVWGQVDADANVLVQVIARLRRMLDADGGDSAIRTVPRFGYHWALPTQVREAAAPPAEPAPRASRPRTVANIGRAARWLLVFAPLVLVAPLSTPRHGAIDAEAPVRALVLPAVVESADGDDWLRLGLMALAIDRLRSAGQPVVPADNIVASTREAGTDATRLASQVEAAWPGGRVLTLQARRQHGRWTVTLAQRRTGEPSLASEATADDVFAATREATDAMATLLGHAPANAAAPAPALLQVEAAALAGRSDEAFALLERIEAPLRRTPEYRYQRAWSQFLAGRLDDAAHDFDALLADTPAADAPVLRARVLNGLANVQYQQGDYAAQRRSADAAVALLDGHDAPAELGRALMSRAVAAVKHGEIDAARRDLQLARVALESGGDRLGMARADLALGVVHKRLGRYGEARTAFAGALANLGTLSDVHDELLACVHLVETHLQLLEPADALALEPRLAALTARAPPSAARRLAQVTRIELLAANGRLRDARTQLADACATPEACAGEPWRLQLAGMRARLGDGAAGLAELDAALAAPQSGPSGRDAGRAWLLLLRRHVAEHDRPAAERVLARMQAWADADAAVETPVYATLARAEAAAARGDARAAKHAFARALADADANLVPADLLVVAQSYVAWLLDAHERAEASIVAGRLATWSRVDFDAALVQLRVQHALGKPPAWDAALRRARALAGERAIPDALTRRPGGEALAAAP